MNPSLEFANYLLEIEAVKINIDKPYTWASGWKSPIYCDNRLTLSYPHIRKFIATHLSDLIQYHYPDVQIITGVATAGIPHALLVAERLDLPFTYVRATPKAHGMGNQIEGKINIGEKIVIIEDLISTGKSSLQVVQHLQAQKHHVIGMAALFTYQFPLASEAFTTAQCSCFTLSDYDSVIEVALKKNYISNSHLDQLQSWRKSPHTWQS